MSTLYLECNMGAAGDMLAAALYEVCDDAQKAEFLHAMQGLFPSQVTVVPQSVSVNGVAATHMAVTVNGCEEITYDMPAASSAHAQKFTEMTHANPHAHSAPGKIAARLDALVLPDAVKADVKAVYEGLASAESRAHGVPVSEIHFHEVGALDAVADVAAVCLLMHLLHPEAVLSSPIAMGSGTVQCAHGILPVPAPATALLLAGVPVWAGPERGELCTPTGAALLRHFVTHYGPMPGMTVEKIGCGAGQKRFATANLLRAFWGAAKVPDSAAPLCGDSGSARDEAIAELSCNLDDATGEEIGFATQLLLDAGALDVFTAPIGMKKCRPAVLLTVLCRPAHAERMAALMLRHTPTLGVRRKDCARYTLPRERIAVDTPYGTVRVKAAAGGGADKAKPEYADVASAAVHAGVSFAAVRNAALRAFDAKK
ncbi:MAG: nickel pincer cofactor biosynthesis protein LarC [Ruthenibacterium sp.]